MPDEDELLISLEFMSLLQGLSPPQLREMAQICEAHGSKDLRKLAPWIRALSDVPHHEPIHRWQ